MTELLKKSCTEKGKTVGNNLGGRRSGTQLREFEAHMPNTHPSVDRLIHESEREVWLERECLKV